MLVSTSSHIYMEQESISNDCNYVMILTKNGEKSQLWYHVIGRFSLSIILYWLGIKKDVQRYSQVGTLFIVSTCWYFLQDTRTSKLFLLRKCRRAI